LTHEENTDGDVLGLYAVSGGALAHHGAQGNRSHPRQRKANCSGCLVREGEIKEKGHCNNIWIEMKDYLIVVDANFPSGAEACMADIKKTSKKPVKYVFDTHHHGDHAYGNPFWTKLGATDTGLRWSCRGNETLRARKAGRSLPKLAKTWPALNLSTAEPPKQTFQREAICP
jgi:glyoxylase-like metal-dependent hydrolase (beta-lactamase superfamily II)